jgi:hypothetical protein
MSNIIFKSGIPIGLRPDYHLENIMGTNEEPWMTRNSINFIYNHIKLQDKYKTLLEYGCGSSTLWFIKVLNLNVTSIEHDKKWLLEVKNKIPSDFINKWTLYFKPNQIYGNDEGSENEYDFYDDYVNCIDVLNNFDIIVIDGRCRSKCIIKSINKLNPGGLFIVDNAERENYKNAIDIIPKNWIKHVFPTSIDTTIVWIKPLYDD